MKRDIASGHGIAEAGCAPSAARGPRGRARSTFTETAVVDIGGEAGIALLGRTTWVGDLSLETEEDVRRTKLNVHIVFPVFAVDADETVSWEDVVRSAISQDPCYCAVREDLEDFAMPRVSRDTADL